MAQQNNMFMFGLKKKQFVSRRVSDVQRMKLTELISNCKNQEENLLAFWMNASRILNNLVGAKKRPMEWRKVWLSLIARTNAKYQRVTTNGRPGERLNSLEVDLLNTTLARSFGMPTSEINVNEVANTNATAFADTVMMNSDDEANGQREEQVNTLPDGNKAQFEEAYYQQKLVLMEQDIKVKQAFLEEFSKLNSNIKEYMEGL